MTETKCPKCGHAFDTASNIPFPVDLHSSQESYEKHRQWRIKTEKRMWEQNGDKMKIPEDRNDIERAVFHSLDSDEEYEYIWKHIRSLSDKELLDIYKERIEVDKK